MDSHNKERHGTTIQLLMGNEAFAHAALEAGVRVAAGYPGTPSSELIETIAKLVRSGAAKNVHVEWSCNEKAALELLAGASMAGARCLFTCKQVGLNVASDPLMSLNYVGIKGGMVLFVADDPGPISSQTEQDTRRFASFAKIPVLDPSTPEEGFAMMQAAFELSEAYGTPVIVRPTTRINHASTFFEIKENTCGRSVAEEGFERSSRWVIFPRRAFEAHGEINVRLKKIAQDYACVPSLAAFNEAVEGGESGEANSSDESTTPRLGIVAGGVSSAYTREALALLQARCKKVGQDVPAYRFWSVGTPYPFPEGVAGSFSQGLDDIYVFEELDHVLEDALLVYAGKTHAPWNVHGKLDGFARDRGENTTDDIAARLAGVFGITTVESEVGAASVVAEQPQTPQKPALPIRPPVLCAGCPHRGSFYAVKRALKRHPAVLCGDIGCYTLGNAMPLDAVDTCLCMGAGITMAQGFSVADPQKKAVAFVGDSTFFASGMTGVANAVYNHHNICVCVLDNRTTAMTGGQPHPGTGETLMGSLTAPLSPEAVLRALGVACIVHADPLNLDEAIAGVGEALDYEGPSAVIFESPCITLIKPAQALWVNAELCSGCKRCITEIGCPAISFDPCATGPRSAGRGQAVIDSSLCVGCGLCSALCPTGALKTSGATDTEASA